MKLLPQRPLINMDLSEALKTLCLWCIALLCVVNGLMLDLALSKVLASTAQIFRDFVGRLLCSEQHQPY
jgi:hypothetical protein